MMVCAVLAGAASAHPDPAEAERPARTLPEPVRADVEAITAQLLEIRDEEVELSCPKAVENARYGVETMLEVGERNRQGGYMTQAQYSAMAIPLREALTTLTLADCEQASGGRLAFYRCMSNDYNHVLACAKLDTKQPD